MRPRRRSRPRAPSAATALHRLGASACAAALLRHAALPATATASDAPVSPPGLPSSCVSPPASILAGNPSTVGKANAAVAPPASPSTPPHPTNVMVTPYDAMVDEGDDDEGALGRFLRDLSRIQELPPSKLTTPCHLISRDYSTTRYWSHDVWTYHCASPFRRYLRHLRSWPTSTTAGNVYPAVFAFVLWATAVSAVSTAVPSAEAFLRRASFSSSLISTFLSPIALLLTLRTNRALDRLLDARKAWGLVIRSCRSLMGVLCAFGMDAAEDASLLAARYLAAFGWTLKASLRPDEDDGDVLRAVLPPEEAAWLMGAPGSRPDAVVARLRHLFSDLGEGGRDGRAPPALSLTAHRILEMGLSDLESALGVCHRIMTTPIPPTYTRHTSRVLCLYLGLLPLALIGLGVSPVALVLLTALTSYVLVGIDEIGVEIEYPFPLLPMYEMATAVQKMVMEQAVLMKDMPPSP